MAVHHAIMGQITIADWIAVIWHGLPMDCTMGGYLTIIPALLSIVAVWTASDNRIVSLIYKIYCGFAATAVAIVATLDLGLYGYWGFRLDTTPFFYFFSSPSSAMASVSPWLIILGLVLCAAAGIAIYKILVCTAGSILIPKTRSVGATILAIVGAGLLFIPIRGSVTVSTMNLSRSYFSQNQKLNHAAINPMFSLMYSATHQSNFSSQFRYFNNNDLEAAIQSLHHGEYEVDSIGLKLKVERPDIYIIILESFSSHLLPSLGGEPVATRLDSIASTGLSFTGFYASGARTDRAIPAILSAFPAQPTTSLMKYAKKIEHVASLPRTLRDKAGYQLSYYYGGDANFTNMQAYLVSSGFDHIVSDKDFPASQLTGKWGAHDHVVFGRVLSEIMSDTATIAPQLRVIQTSSSHEPFEVPYSDPRFADSPRKNAFAYTDCSLGNFIDSLAASPSWQNTLVLITPDHYGAYPQNIDNPLSRHHIPFVITGGALDRSPATIDVTADQTAIAATLLNALGIDYSDFTFSHDMFDRTARQYAFFSEPGIAGYITPTDTVVINLDAGTNIISSGIQPDSATAICKAILQSVYIELDKL